MSSTIPLCGAVRNAVHCEARCMYITSLAYRASVVYVALMNCNDFLNDFLKEFLNEFLKEFLKEFVKEFLKEPPRNPRYRCVPKIGFRFHGRQIM